MMRARLVSGRAAGLDDTGAGRFRGAALAGFRAVERVAAAGLDLGFVMGSSEVLCGAIRRTTSAPAEQNTRQGRILKPAQGHPPIATLCSGPKTSQF
jgi:hypothetical protein